MIINDLEFYLVEIDCVGQRLPVRSLLVRLATDGGLEGWGEAHLKWRASELQARREVLLPILAGRSVFDIADLLELDSLNSAPLRSALEMASWDVVGQIAGQPLCHLLGGGYRQRIPITIRIGSVSEDQTVQLVQEMADQGFHSQIITSFGQPQRDLDTLAAAHGAAGDRIELRLDAGASYDMDTARDLCAELENQAVHFVLDPLNTNELEQVASLRRQTSVPLAIRQLVRNPADLLAAVRCGASPFVVVDLGLVGGILAARECAAIARAAGISSSLGGAPSLGIGVAAMLQLAASTPAFANCNECAYHLIQDDLLQTPLEIIDGMITVPRGPGLGVQIDRGKLERLGVRE